MNNFYLDLFENRLELKNGPFDPWSALVTPSIKNVLGMTFLFSLLLWNILWAVLKP